MSKEKLILKDQGGWPGIDKSFNDRSMWCTTPVVQTYITKPIHKIHRTGYIGLKDKLIPGEVLQTGNFRYLYKVVEHSKPTDREGHIHKIVKVEGTPIRQIDIENTKVGMAVLITSRSTPKERAELDTRKYFKKK